MTHDETLWLAGLYEGEGSVTNGPMKGRKSFQLRLEIGSTDRDVVESVQRRTGLGKIKTRATGRPKPMHRWIVCARHEVLEVLEAIHPHLHERRRSQVEPVMEHCRARLAIRRPNGTPRRTRKEIAERLDKLAITM